MPIRIDWNKLKLLPQDADKSFEEFCYHIVSHLYGQYGTLGYFYNTPGSEFYIELNKPLNIDGVEYASGDVLGWQAKFWRGEHDDENSSLNMIHIGELEKGFNTTVKYKSSIKLWVICTPGTFVQSQWDKLYDKLKLIKCDCQFTSWHRVTFEDFYQRDHNNINGIFRYYFGESYAIKKTIDDISKDTLSRLNKKFDIDLHTPTDFEDSLLSIANSDKAKVLLVDSIEKLTCHVAGDKKKPTIEKSIWYYDKFSQNYWNLYIEDFSERENLVSQLDGFLNNKDHILENVVEIKLIIDKYENKRKSRVDAINKELKNTFNKYGSNQMLINSINEMIGRVNRLERLITPSKENDNTCISAIVNRITTKDISVFAEAGYGKTHFACSLTSNMLNCGKPVLFLTGSTFRNCNDCESKIRSLLHLSEQNTIFDVLDALDFVAEMHHCRLPIIIDGLNETVPYAYRWKEELPPLKRKIIERQNLILVTTCRAKEDYIQLIYGESNYEQIENHVLLPGIHPKDLSNATKLYFNKYNIKPNNQTALNCFTNPLLLKVFCEVNKGRCDFELNDYVLATCMKDYSQKLIDNIATENGKINRIKRHQIEEGLNKVAMTIWKKNDRQLDFFNEFANIFGSSAEDFLNESMCFIAERFDGRDTIQFAYDLVAGFHIAKAIVDKATNAQQFCYFIEEHYVMLFGKQRHTLAEDIVRSLFYLVPIYYQKQWYELMPKAEIISVAIEHLDIIASNSEGEKSLIKLLDSNYTPEIKERICSCLYDRIFYHHNILHLSLFIPLFIKMNALEIDTWWNSKFAGYEKLNDIWGVLHDKFWSNHYNPKDKIALSLLLCGIVDREYRDKFYNKLFELVEEYTELGLNLCQSIIKINDYYIFETVVSIVAGVGLRTMDARLLKRCIDILENYLKSSTASHIVLIDNLDTLYCYAKSVFDIEYDRKLLYKNKEEYWPVEDEEGISWYNLYDYDFDKYNIRPLYNSGYRMTATFTPKEIYGKLWARIKSKGYDKSAYVAIQNTEDKYVKYRRELRVNYAHKIGRGVLMELYGWLTVNNSIANVFKNSFRTSIIDIDPTHPKFHPKRTLITQSMLPKKLLELTCWMKKDHVNVAEKLFFTTLPCHNGKWVLMRGFCTQKIEERYVNLYLSGTSQLIPCDMSEDEAKNISLDDAIDYSSAFASELWWRHLEYTEDYVSDAILPSLLVKYSFSGWDSSRFQYSNFYMLNLEIAEKIGLRFNMQEMSYYLGEEQVSMYFVNDEGMYFYLKSNVVDMILKNFNAKLRHHIYESRFVIGNPPKDKVELSDNQKFKECEKDIFYYL